MQFYRTKDILNIPVGFKLGLNEIQIMDRKQSLILKAKGKCEVKIPIQFKTGELVGIENPNKIMLKVLEEIVEKKGDPKN